MKERPSTAFDFRGSVEDTTFTDIDSSADRVVAAKDSNRNVFERIWHEPLRTSEGINWVKVGAIAGVVGAAAGVLAIAATVVFGLLATGLV